MLRGCDVVEAPGQFAAVCELHVWSQPSLSWFVSSVMVRRVLPEDRNLVGSEGLSEVIFMYCADAGPATLSSSSAASRGRRGDGFTSALRSRLDGPAPTPTAQARQLAYSYSNVATSP